MQDYYTFKGHFCIQCLDDNDNIIDSYEDKNFIMKPARRTVSEMFAKYKNEGLNYLILGTCGGADTPYIPITEENGFDKERTSLYAEYKTCSKSRTYKLYKHEIIKVGGSYYKYTQDTGNVYISNSSLSSKFISAEKPYTYKLTVSGSATDGISNIAVNNDNTCTILYNTDTGDNLNNTTVTYTFEIGMSQGNGQNSETSVSVFNEAGLYVNSRLFSMKCFPAKVKDSATKLKIIWKIIF